MRSIAPTNDVSEGVVLGFVVGVRVEISTFARGFGGYLFWGCLLFRLRFVQGGSLLEVRGYRNLQGVSQQLFFTFLRQAGSRVVRIYPDNG